MMGRKRRGRRTRTPPLALPGPSLFLRLSRPAWAGRQTGRRGAMPPSLYYLAGILARFRAMASSTAFSCFSSSSRRDSVLLGFPEPEPAADAEPDGGGLPGGISGPFPDDLEGGDRGRFLRKENGRVEVTILIHIN